MMTVHSVPKRAQLPHTDGRSRLVRIEVGIAAQDAISLRRRPTDATTTTTTVGRDRDKRSGGGGLGLDVMARGNRRMRRWRWRKRSHSRGIRAGFEAPAGGALPPALLLAVGGDALARRDPLGAGLPVPAVARGVGHGEEPQEGLGAEQVQQVALGAQVERVRQLLRVDLVQVLLVALARALPLHLLVGELALAGRRVLGEVVTATVTVAVFVVEVGTKAAVVVVVAVADHLAFFGARDARERVRVDVEELLAVARQLDALAAVLHLELVL